jgi:3-hydroxyacyl-[acyl-carrier-protein] dehydratase
MKPVLPISRKQIEALIPHRYPFLLVDEVIELEPGTRIVAIKHISDDDPVLAGHFPGNPVYPGVYQVEGLAQAAAILGKFNDSVEGNEIFLTEINSARFRRIVKPGDILKYEVTFEKHRAPFFWFVGKAYCGDDLAVQVRLSAKMP